MPVTDIVFWRNFSAIMVMMPWWVRAYEYAGTIKLSPYMLRSLCGITAMILWFYALHLLPLADAVVISFTAPIFVTLSAIIILKEVVKIHRWVAIAFGFIGVLVIVQPSNGNSLPWIGVVCDLLAAVVGAISVTLIKHLSGKHPPTLMLTIMTAFMSFFSLPLLWFGLNQPTDLQFFVIMTMGATAILGQYGMIRALTLMDSSEASPFDFLRLPFTAGFGYLFFSEKIGLSTIIGGTIIFLSNLYIIKRERQYKRDLLINQQIIQ